MLSKHALFHLYLSTSSISKFKRSSYNYQGFDIFSKLRDCCFPVLQAGIIDLFFPIHFSSLGSELIFGAQWGRVFRVKLQQLVQLSGSELLLFFLCLVGLVPTAVHVAVMVTRKKYINNFPFSNTWVHVWEGTIEK